MARRSRMSVLKRQREMKKNEKAAHKRAKRHGLPMHVMAEPIPTVRMGDLMRVAEGGEEGEVEDSEEVEADREEDPATEA